MSRNLDRILFRMDQVASSEGNIAIWAIDAKAKFLVALFSLIAMLTLPLYALGRIALWIMPLVCLSIICRINYLRLMLASLSVVPFVFLIGFFDILYQREVVATIAGVAITRGWVTTLVLILRALISVQTILLLVRTTGVYSLCRAMQNLGMPAIFAVQMLFVYRFFYLMLVELNAILRSADARSAGLKRYPLRLWGRIIAELLMRTIGRAKEVERAMRVRLWSGGVPIFGRGRGWRLADTLFLAISILVIALLRFI